MTLSTIKWHLVLYLHDILFTTCAMNTIHTNLTQQDTHKKWTDMNQLVVPILARAKFLKKYSRGYFKLKLLTNYNFEAYKLLIIFIRLLYLICTTVSSTSTSPSKDNIWKRPVCSLFLWHLLCTFFHYWFFNYFVRVIMQFLYFNLLVFLEN